MSDFKPPCGPKPEDMEWIASSIADCLKNRLQKGTLTKVTTEAVIDEFRRMNDDYDDWWVRGLTTKEKEIAFIKDLLTRLEYYDITEVEDNTYI